MFPFKDFKRELAQIYGRSNVSVRKRIAGCLYFSVNVAITVQTDNLTIKQRRKIYSRVQDIFNRTAKESEETYWDLVLRIKDMHGCSVPRRK